MDSRRLGELITLTYYGVILAIGIAVIHCLNRNIFLDILEYALCFIAGGVFFNLGITIFVKKKGIRVYKRRGGEKK